MIDSHDGPDGKFPNVNEFSLPVIDNRKKGNGSNIWSWKRFVQGALIQLKLEDVIDDKFSQSSERDPGCERGRSWFTVIRCTRLNRLDFDVIEDEQLGRYIEAKVDSEDRLLRHADELYIFIGKAFMAGGEYVKSNAAVFLRAVHREKF
ncbi:hypothetical protein F1880_010033 [Penicillium rolfsii]|nr:hypothetical protein F1880_010033 [Penicillium rolfsii]